MGPGWAGGLSPPSVLRPPPQAPAQNTTLAKCSLRREARADGRGGGGTGGARTAAPEKAGHGGRPGIRSARWGCGVQGSPGSSPRSRSFSPFFFPRVSASLGEVRGDSRRQAGSSPWPPAPQRPHPRGPGETRRGPSRGNDGERLARPRWRARGRRLAAETCMYRSGNSEPRETGAQPRSLASRAFQSEFPPVELALGV